jgi:hypothetical protein
MQSKGPLDRSNQIEIPDHSKTPFRRARFRPPAPTILSIFETPSQITKDSITCMYIVLLDISDGLCAEGQRT